MEDGCGDLAGWRDRQRDAQWALGLAQTAADPPLGNESVGRGSSDDAFADDAPLRLRVAATIRALLRQRALESSLCPSEAARVVGGDGWRTLMPLVRDVAWSMEASGWLRISRGGERLRAPSPGTLRLARGPNFSETSQTTSNECEGP